MKRFFKYTYLCCLLLLLQSVAIAEEATDYHFKGNHFIASYCDCDREALSNVEALAAAMQQAVETCGATILDSSSWVFPPNGLTMVFLLSESHASIHTYPEHGACFVDLFTCGHKCSAEKFDQAMRSYLKPESVAHESLIRDDKIERL